MSGEPETETNAMTYDDLLALARRFEGNTLKTGDGKAVHRRRIPRLSFLLARVERTRSVWTTLSAGPVMRLRGGSPLDAPTTLATT